MRVTPQSRAVFLRMLERRRELGLPELGLPLAADIDAARRAPLAPDDEPDPLSPPTATAAPAAVPLPVIDVAPAEPLLTAPRRRSISVSNVAPVAPLAPEPVRRKRPPVGEVIERVSGPVASASATVPGLDDDVDVAAAVVRARALAGGGLDAELDALAEAAAAPVEISIEAASAELARQLGGNAVRRDRSARWMMPPATTTATNPVVPAAAEPGREAAHDLDTPREPQAAFSEPEPAPEPEPSDDVDELDELDLEDVEHTELGEFPDRSSGLSAIDEAMLAARLEVQLAEAEAEDLDLDGGEHDLSLEEIDDFEILAEADASDEHLLAAATDPERSGRHVLRAGTPSELDFAARLDLGDDSDPYLGLSAAEIARRRAGGDRGSRSRVSDPHFDSAGHALAAFEADDSLGETAVRERVDATTGVQPIFELETSNSFTLAGVLTDSLDLDAPSSSIQPVHAAREPAILRAPPAAQHPRPAKLSPSLYDSPVEDHELEHALEALDVDLDDLSIPHADTHLQRGLGPSTTRQSPVIRPASATRKPASIGRGPVASATPSASRLVASRPPSDDGVALEFEEEE
jgi:hypothetical protein